MFWLVFFFIFRLSVQAEPDRCFPAVDVTFVVDDTFSMFESVNPLRSILPSLLQDNGPFESLRFGIVLFNDEPKCLGHDHYVHRPVRVLQP